jgi:hypothetical protein
MARWLVFELCGLREVRCDASTRGSWISRLDFPIVKEPRISPRKTTLCDKVSILYCSCPIYVTIADETMVSFFILLTIFSSFARGVVESAMRRQYQPLGNGQLVREAL